MAPIQSPSKPCVLLLMILAVCPSLCWAQRVDWHSLSRSAFGEAASQHKFVLLNIESSGSHWCHVMDSDTYAAATVARLLSQSYVAVRVDSASAPDVANRYRDDELPATIIFNSDGSEILRKQRFLSPRQMASLLKAVIEDPTPVDSIRLETAFVPSTNPIAAKDLVSILRNKFNSQYDVPDQNWAFGSVYLDPDSIEFASSLSLQGDKSQEQWVVDRLEKSRKLIDPVWGGAFQALVAPVTAAEDQRVTRFMKIQIGGVLDSDGDSWNDPHYEKPLIVEAAAMQIFAKAFGQWQKPDYLAGARNVRRYIREFLTSPDGAFYTGQDSQVAGAIDSDSYFSGDDSFRRSHGLPSVDTHIYTSENGRMIEALCQLYTGTGDPADLRDAERCANWVISHAILHGGGFTHSQGGPDALYLCDSLEAGRAFLALYKVSKDRRWLDRAAAAAHFIDATFRGSSDAGFVTVQSSNIPGYPPHPDREENARLVRFAHQLAGYTGDKAHELMAARAMRYLVTPERAKAGFSASVLLACGEFTAPAPAPVSDPVEIPRWNSR